MIEAMQVLHSLLSGLLNLGRTNRRFHRIRGGDLKQETSAVGRAATEPQALPVHPWSRPHGYRRRGSGGAQIVCRGFAGPAIGYNLERNPLSLVEAVHASTFDGADVHEDILAAIIRLDKTEAFLSVEPLHCTLRHMTLLSGVCLGRPRSRAARFIFEIWRKVVSPTRIARQGQVVRPKLDRL
jgi:hypothetical protein